MVLGSSVGRFLLPLCLLAGCAEDPFAIEGPRSCEIPDQNHWIMGLMDQVYLWNDTLPEVDPLEYESPKALIRDLRFEQDSWSRISDKTTSDALYREGMIISFGWRTRRDADGNLRIASVHAASSAGELGLRRGDRLLGFGGYTIEEIDEMDLWRDVLGPREPGFTVEAEVEHIEDGTVEIVEVTKDWVEIATVSHEEVLDFGQRKTGYLVFETFVDPAKVALKNTFDRFRRAGVSEVVVDLRYNGGGLLSVSRLLADLVGGSRANGEVMYRKEHNDELADQNVEKRFKRRDESVDIDHVVFITSRNTVSASELVINSLRPYVDVHIVGDRTGGKPFGMLSWSFCEQVAFPITFRLVNADGVTDYFSGLQPDCVAEDDLLNLLGDPTEGSLDEALTVLETGTCSPEGLQPAPALGPKTDRLYGDRIDELVGGSW